MTGNFLKVLALVMAVMPLQSAAQTSENAPRITVSGEGSIRVVPDVARINVGVRHLDATAARALDGVTQGLTGIFAQLESAGIAASDMQTGSVNVSRHYNNGRPASDGTQTAFEASSEVTVMIRDLDMLGVVLDAVVRDGANTLNGLRFDVTDRTAHIRAARIAAVKDAQLAAQTYAGAAGLTLGPVVAITTGGQSAAPMARASFAMAQDKAVPIAAGEIEVNRRVQIVYELIAE